MLNAYLDESKAARASWLLFNQPICVHLSMTHPMMSFVWQLPELLAMNSVSAKADRAHVYFMDMCCNGIHLCVCKCFGRMLVLKVRVHRGGLVIMDF